jgi:hypothetical protein
MLKIRWLRTMFLEEDIVKNKRECDRITKKSLAFGAERRVTVDRSSRREHELETYCAYDM